MMCADLVDVRWKDKSGRGRRAVANLEDISLSGACLQVDVQIPLTTMVRISYPKGEFSGVVRYCQFKEIGYYVGVKFEDGCKWSKTSFKPLHLLDPRGLAKRTPERGKNGPEQRSAN
jgi:PilZ domain